MTDETAEGRVSDEIQAEVVAKRDNGAAWNQLADAYGLTRQQVRYAYQLGKRKERRRTRRTT